MNLEFEQRQVEQPLVQDFSHLFKSDLSRGRKAKLSKQNSPPQSLAQIREVSFIIPDLANSSKASQRARKQFNQGLWQRLNHIAQPDKLLLQRSIEQVQQLHGEYQFRVVQLEEFPRGQQPFVLISFLGEFTEDKTLLIQSEDDVCVLLGFQFTARNPIDAYTPLTEDTPGDTWVMAFSMGGRSKMFLNKKWKDLIQKGVKLWLVQKA